MGVGWSFYFVVRCSGCVELKWWWFCWFLWCVFLFLVVVVFCVIIRDFIGMFVCGCGVVFAVVCGDTFVIVWACFLFFLGGVFFCELERLGVVCRLC